MDFFDRVKEFTKRKTALTLRAFIGYLGLNYETYYSGKRRENLPRADEAVKLAKALKTTVEELVDGDNGAEYVRKIVRNDPKALQVPDRIRDIVDDLLIIDDNDLIGIRANIRAVADMKRPISTM